MGKRLLLLVTDLLIGGTPTVVRELAVRLHREGVEVQVACLAGWGPMADQIYKAGVKVTALEAKGALDWGVFGKLARLIRDEQIDVVLSFLVHANVAASIARARGGFVLHQSIQTTQPRPRWHWWAQWMVGRFARTVLVPSDSVAAVARRRAWIPAGKIVVIPNAVDPAAVRPAVEPVAGRVRIAFVGRLDPVKRIPDLLEAVSVLPDGYQLAIHGTGGQEPAIRARIQRLGISGRAVLKGASDEPWGPLAEADVLVLPSEAEGFGLVLIEAMAAGVPVVATDAPGIRDVVRDGENGILVPVGNPPALAMAIRRAAKDEAFRAKLVDGGRRTVQQEYGWVAVLEKYRQTLEL